MSKNYPKITKDIIEKIVSEIINVLCENELAGDMGIYYNNKRTWITHKFDENWESVWVREDKENIDPHDYFEWAAYNHIISISTEGGLYEQLNYGSGEFPRKLEQMFREYGIYYEFGDSWNLTFFPVDEEDRIEYTIYKKPSPPKYIYLMGDGSASDKTPREFEPIMQEWWRRSEATGDYGGCVIGAKIKFWYKDEEYHMAPCSPWQGEGSWEPHVEYVKKELQKLGATNLYWDYGRLD